MKTKRILISALVATLVLCTVAATVSPSVQAGTGWSGGAIPGTASSKWNGDPSLAYTSWGDPRVVYHDRWVTFNLWYYARAGGVWYSKLVDTKSSFSALTLKNNLPWISYYDQTNGDLKCAWKDANGQWHYERVDTAGNVGWSTSICISPLDGQPRISYYDQTKQDLKYARRVGLNNWVTETVDAGSYPGLDQTSIAINPATKGVGIGYDYGLNYIKYAWKNPGMAKFSSTFVVDKGSSDYPSLAFDAAGNPCISYRGGGLGVTDLKYTKHLGALPDGTWYYKTFPTAALDGMFTSIALSNFGNPRISSFSAQGSVTYTWKDTSGVWHTEYVGNGFESTSIAIYRSTGKTGICYFDETGAYPGYTYTVNLMEKMAGF
jgi:hypothetical protein